MVMWLVKNQRGLTLKEQFTQKGELSLKKAIQDVDEFLSEI